MIGIPGDRLVRPSGSIGIPGDRHVKPSGSIGIPGDRHVKPSGSIGIPGDRHVKPSGSIGIPGDRHVKPSGSIGIPGDRLVKPSGSTGIPGDRHVKPSGSIGIPGDRHVKPSGSIGIPGDRPMKPTGSPAILGEPSIAPRDFGVSTRSSKEPSGAVSERSGGGRLRSGTPRKRSAARGRLGGARLREHRDRTRGRSFLAPTYPPLRVNAPPLHVYRTLGIPPHGSSSGSIAPLPGWSCAHGYVFSVQPVARPGAARMSNDLPPGAGMNCTSPWTRLPPCSRPVSMPKMRVMASPASPGRRTGSLHRPCPSRAARGARRARPGPRRRPR